MTFKPKLKVQYGLILDTSRERKGPSSKKSKTVKLVPKEHACQPARLPILEVIFYVLGWTAAALYSLYAVLELSMGTH